MVQDLACWSTASILCVGRRCRAVCWRLYGTAPSHRPVGYLPRHTNLNTKISRLLPSGSQQNCPQDESRTSTNRMIDSEIIDSGMDVHLCAHRLWNDGSWTPNSVDPPITSVHVRVHPFVTQPASGRGESSQGSTADAAQSG